MCVQSTEETERERQRDREKILGSGENFGFVWRVFAKECTKEVVFPNYLVVVVSCEKPQISCHYIYGFDILSIVTTCDSCCHRLGAQFFFDYSFGFRNREFFTRFFFLGPSVVVLCFALSICICIINSFCLLFSVGNQEREKERCEVLKKDCWEIRKKGGLQHLSDHLLLLASIRSSGEFLKE